MDVDGKWVILVFCFVLCGAALLETFSTDSSQEKRNVIMLSTVILAGMVGTYLWENRKKK